MNAKEEKERKIWCRDTQNVNSGTPFKDRRVQKWSRLVKMPTRRKIWRQREKYEMPESAKMLRKVVMKDLKVLFFLGHLCLVAQGTSDHVPAKKIKGYWPIMTDGHFWARPLEALILALHILRCAGAVVNRTFALVITCFRTDLDWLWGFSE